MVNGYIPECLKEALKIRAEKTVVPYAGGTDLMLENRPEVCYLFLGKLDELRQIRTDEDYIRIGAAVSFSEALASNLVPPLMKEAIGQIAAPAIRNAGTFGGNLANGSSKADSVLVDYAADAKLRLLSVRGERIVDVDSFCLGRRRLDLADDELIAEILLPKTGLDNYYYKKVGGRNALAISRVSFAGRIVIENNTITCLSCAFGAVADTVLRFKDLEAKLIGRTVEEARATKSDVLKAYSDRLVLTQGRVSAEYRKAVCMNLLRDFFESKGI